MKVIRETPPETLRRLAKSADRCDPFSKYEGDLLRDAADILEKVATGCVALNERWAAMLVVAERENLGHLIEEASFMAERAIEEGRTIGREVNAEGGRDEMTKREARQRVALCAWLELEVRRSLHFSDYLYPDDASQADVARIEQATRELTELLADRSGPLVNAWCERNAATLKRREPT
jgi:hypothetical protein